MSILNEINYLIRKAKEIYSEKAEEVKLFLCFSWEMGRKRLETVFNYIQYL